MKRHCFGRNRFTVAVTKAYLHITLKVGAQNRAASRDGYSRCRKPFLKTVLGGWSKQLLIRSEEDVQVLQSFGSREHAQTCLTSELFAADVAVELASLLDAAPDVLILDAHSTL